MSEHPRGELASSRLVRLGFRDPDGTLVNLFTPVAAEAIQRFDG